MNHRIPFYVKLGLSYALVIALFTLGILWMAFLEIKANNQQTVRDRLAGICISLSGSAAGLLDQNDPSAAQLRVKELASRLQIRLTIIRPDGTVLADSEHDPSTMDNHASRPEISRALQGMQGDSIRNSPTLQAPMLYVATPAAGADGAARGVIRASMMLQEIGSLYSAIIVNIAWLAGVAMLAALAAALLISRHLTRPVDRLVHAADQVYRGDFTVRVLLKNQDELGDLGSAFNRMTAQIEQLFNEVLRHREEFAAIVKSIREGLLVIDSQSRILHANHAFQQICQASENTGKLYWDVIRNPELAALLRKARETGTNQQGEIEFHQRYYLCGVTLLPPDGKLVALFFDITEMKRLEDIKRDLVINISHELKTPLTSIIGFAEALESEPVQHREYLEIIKRNATRLANIINDLLVLAKLEQPVRRLETEPVDLPGLVRNTARLIEPLLNEKGLTFDITAADSVPKIVGDPALLEQVFLNLLDNAARYTDQGGIQVDFRLDGRWVRTDVRDTGIGIPVEHQPRIFERFYVVDQSRSRQRGGTGLGLSIVRNAVLQHEGRIEVQSAPGRGTVISVFLPVAGPESANA